MVATASLEPVSTTYELADIDPELFLVVAGNGMKLNMVVQLIISLLDAVVDIAPSYSSAKEWGG